MLSFVTKPFKAASTIIEGMRERAETPKQGQRFKVVDADAFNKVSYGTPTHFMPEDGDVLECIGANKNWGGHPAFKAVVSFTGSESLVPTLNTSYKARKDPSKYGLEFIKATTETPSTSEEAPKRETVKQHAQRLSVGHHNTRR